MAKLKLHVFDAWDSSLIQLRLKSYSKLTFEVKTDEEEFEVYDPNIFPLRYTLYQEG